MGRRVTVREAEPAGVVTADARAFPLVARTTAGTTPVSCPAGSVTWGQGTFVVVAGPCSVESEDQILRTAEAVGRAGAHCLRGGAFKPRTSPYSFRGLGREGLELLVRARAATGLPIVTEVLNAHDVALVAEFADVLQVGARNMQNTGLLEAVGRAQRPVLLKRGPAATVEEWLLSAEWIASQGNDQIVLCERGIRTFETATRYTLDLSSVLVAKRRTRLPVIVDPSHAAGRADLVPPLARAALAAGADGVMVEVHRSPADARSDADQALGIEQFANLMRDLVRLAPLAGLSI
jgi:3-deoxy-7-phosphoheptulonate synthase